MDFELLFPSGFNYDTLKDYDRIVVKMNQDTKEEDYADTADINTMIFSPITVPCVGSLNSIVIKFHAKYIKPNNYIDFFGEFYYEKKNYKSRIYKLDLMGFLNIAMKSAYLPNSYIDDMDEIKQLKNKIIADFAEDLFEENIILGDFELEGLGFVEAEDKKILAFNKFNVKINKNNSSKVNELSICIGNCVGIAQLTKVNKFKIYFLTDKYKIELDKSIEIKSSDESYLKNYMLSTPKISVIKQENISLDLPNEKDIEEYVFALSKLLDNTSTEEKHINETFDDDFF